MLGISEIKIGTIIKINNEPYSVIRSEHHKMGRGGAVLKTKLRNLITGNILERTFQGNEKAEEANVEKKKANYLYKDTDKAYFMDNDSYEQFELNLEELGGQEKFMKDGIDVTIVYFNNRPVGMELPIKMDLKVVSAPPGVKGNTASNTTKQVELETGASIAAPLFINEGDVIRINTDTGEYVERA
jgi:elongation factor P